MTSKRFLILSLFFSLFVMVSIYQNASWVEGVSRTEVVYDGKLGGTSNRSHFPYAVTRKGHRFVYFSQLISGEQGEGSISIVAVRKYGEDTWTSYNLFNTDDKATLRINPHLAEVLDELDVLSSSPLYLRNYVIKKGSPPEVIRFKAPEKMVLFNSGFFDKYEKKYFRTGYLDGDVWLLDGDIQQHTWSRRRDDGSGHECKPIASQSGLEISEAAVARVNEKHWVAIIREGLAQAATNKQNRRLFQVDSFDNGCSWSQPHLMGDGFQPNFLRVKWNSNDERLVFCVGDQIEFGEHKSVGIRCRLSNNLLLPSEQLITWNESKMIFLSPTTNDSDLGHFHTLKGKRGMLETYFYANFTQSELAKAGTDIVFVRHSLYDLPCD